MNTFTKFSIEDSDAFDEALYPKVAREINDLQQRLLRFKSDRKANIVISLLKDHSVTTAWLEGNAELAHLLTQGRLQTSQIEDLFNSARGKIKFTTSYEEFLVTKFT